MDIFSIIAEDKIKQAIKDGEFENLPGQGKPLQLEDLSHIPEELRVAYKVLKNSRMLNDVDQLKKELFSVEQLLESCEDYDEREWLTTQKKEKQLRLDELLKKRKVFDSPASAFYKKKILGKLKR